MTFFFFFLPPFQIFPLLRGSGTCCSLICVGPFWGVGMDNRNNSTIGSAQQLPVSSLEQH